MRLRTTLQPDLDTAARHYPQVLQWLHDYACGDDAGSSVQAPRLKPILRPWQVIPFVKASSIACREASSTKAARLS